MQTKDIRSFFGGAPKGAVVTVGAKKKPAEGEPLRPTAASQSEQLAGQKRPQPSEKSPAKGAAAADAAPEEAAAAPPAAKRPALAPSAAASPARPVAPAAAPAAIVDDDDDEEDIPITSRHFSAPKAAAAAAAVKASPKKPSGGKKKAAMSDDDDDDDDFVDLSDSYDEDDDDDDVVVSEVDDTDSDAGKGKKGKGGAASSKSSKPAVTKKIRGTNAVMVLTSPAHKKGGAGSGSAPPSASRPTGPSEPIVTRSGIVIPVGTPDALAGTKWCITGELAAMSREDATAYLKRHGADVVGGMSGRVSHLLVGDKLEDGRPIEAGSKYLAAQENQAKGKPKPDAPTVIMRQDELFDLVEESLPPELRKRAEMQAKVTAEAAGLMVGPLGNMEDVGEGGGAATSSSSSGGGAGSSSSSSSSAPALPRPPKLDLWTEKYRPRHFQAFVGNKKELDQLDNWLRDWRPAPREGFERGAGPRGRDCRAALLSGPPGIGKTSAALLIAKLHGYEVLEMNASDARGKKVLQEGLEVAKNYRELGSSGGAGGQMGLSHRKRLIIMDEVDGMSSGDRGGNAELCKIIQCTQTPIICVCNDREKDSVRTLAKYCYDIKFLPPTPELLKARLAAIAAAEGLHPDMAALESVIATCNGDIRMCVNVLQMWASSSARSSTDAMLKDPLLRLDWNSASMRMFTEARTSSLDARADLFYVDYDFIPLIVQQLYPQVLDRSGLSDAIKLKCLARSADAVSDGDIYNDYVRARQAWGLLPSVAMANVRATTYVTGPPPVGAYFPQWLGQNSRRNKRARLLAELGLRIAPKVSGGREAVRLDYLDPLRNTLLGPLRGELPQEAIVPAVTRVISMLDEYGLSRDDFMDTMLGEVVFIGKEGAAAEAFPDPSKLIVSRVKATFTREYNKTVHTAQSLGMVTSGLVASFRGRKSNVKVSMDGEEEEEEDEALDSADEGGSGDEDEEGGGGAKAAPAAAARGRGGAAAGRGRGRGRGGAAAGR